MSPSLRSVQCWFQEAITSHDTLDTSLQQAQISHGLSVEAVLTRSPALSARERLGIYHSGYRARLLECLADDYPALLHTLGHDAFEQLVRGYVAKYPPHAATLNAYGRHMPQWCRDRALNDALFLSDLARLEWALVEIVHESSSPKLQAEALHAVLPKGLDNVVLQPSAALRVLRFDYPVNAFYRAFREDAEIGPPQPQPCGVAVFRDGRTLYRMDLTLPMVSLLEALASGRPLGAALTVLQSHPGVEPGQVRVWFERWVSDGLFTSVSAS